MAMGIVDDKDFDAELNRLNQPTGIKLPDKPHVIVDTSRGPGRKEGDVNVPNSVRKLIGDVANTDSRRSALSLANDLGISPSSVSAYTKGATSTSTINTPKEENKKHIKSMRQRLASRAKKKLRIALDSITEQDLEHAKLVDKAATARHMASIVKMMEDDDDDSKNNGGMVNNGPTIVLYNPGLKTEADYGVVHAKE